MPSPTRQPITGRAESALEERINAIDRDVLGRFSTVDREIAGIKRDVHGLGDKIDTLVSSIGASRATNWQPLLTAGILLLGIVSTIGALAYAPIYGSINELKEARLYQYRTEEERFVPRVEINVLRESYDKELVHLQDGLADIKERFGSTYTVRDAFQDLEKRIDRLQDIVTSPLTDRPRRPPAP